MEDRLYLKVKKSFLQMFTGETIVFFASFFAGYFYALILGPNDYGVWQTAKVFISYSIVFTFSLPFVMRRDFVMLRSEGKHEEAKKIADLVFTYELFLTPLISLGLILYSLFFIENYLLKLSMMTVGAIYVSQFIGGYGNLLAKGLNNYNLLKKASILNGILTILTVPLVYFFGINSLFIATIIIAMINSVYYFVNRPFSFNLFWDNKLFKTLLIISFPLYLQDISSTIFDSIDRLIIARYLNFSEVGYYSLSSLVIIPLRLLISSFSVVLFTQLNEKYGFSNADHVIEKHVIIPHKILSVLFPPLLGIAVILLPTVVTFFLPKYVLGISSAQIALFGMFIFLLNTFSANALFVVNKQKITAIVYFVVGVFKTILCYLSMVYGYGIIGIACSTVISFLVLDFLMLRIVFKQLKKSPTQFYVYFLKEIFPTIFIALVCFLFFLVSPKLEIFFSSFTITIIGLTVVLISSLPMLIIAKNRVKELSSNQ
ncbi:polysaccharide biosynthesis C-terminal domain-containing protein [Flavobacterium aquidurense]|uniref:oligosaccharide flippase family protein n=1 Tax=Flavobacterium aquidurense TaxID=362413 RepID=UPI0028555DC1|nr:polysaccharide biosynthesis C-terminal domain-containing protein [Flavobacterium aquidurense]MDR7372354.1 O-antigen/teichoic acid export membrane protein [Flavobacterium aquidurense]